MAKIDLHMHSTFSDGKLTPKELVDWAIRKKIPAISITDHDKVSANIEAEKYSKDKPIEYISGIEITATPPEGSKELHIVGLFVDYNNKDILEIHKKHRIYALSVTKKIIKKLNDLGYEISLDELLKETKEEHLGRPFIAQILMKKYPKEFSDRKEVFNKLLGKQGKAFVRPRGTPMKKAIEIIHNAKGIAIIAHPWYLGENMEKIINKFAKLGGDGIEVECHIKDSIPKDMEGKLRDIAKKKKLIISGGTDFHELEDNKKEIGDRGLTLQEFEKLKECLYKSTHN